MVVVMFQSMARNWCEEFEEKMAYTQMLPHLVTGIWPVDSQSQAVAQECVRSFDATPVQKRHRVAFRFCSLSNKFGLAMRMLAQTGECADELAAESKDMNMASTCEQSVEQIHSLLNARQRRSGRCEEVWSLDSAVRLQQNLRSLRPWPAQVFCRGAWFHFLEIAVLKCTDLPREFVYHACLTDKWLAIFHSHSRQHFADLSKTRKAIEAWQGIAADGGPALGTEEKAVLAYLRSRLGGQVFSVNTEIVQACPPQPFLFAAGVVNEVFTIAASENVPQAVGHSNTSISWFQELNANVKGRYYHGDSHSYKVSCITAMALEYDILDVGGKVTFKYTPGSHVRIDLLQWVAAFGIQRLLSTLTVWDARIFVCLFATNKKRQHIHSSEQHGKSKSRARTTPALQFVLPTTSEQSGPIGCISDGGSLPWSRARNLSPRIAHADGHLFVYSCCKLTLGMMRRRTLGTMSLMAHFGFPMTELFVLILPR